MLKNILGPVQAWLLSQGKCVGCGRVLERPSQPGVTRVDCVCGRVYMYDGSSQKFRRALINEIK